VFKEFLINVLTVGVFSIYTIGTLWLADSLLSHYLPGYVFSGNYKIGISVFFIMSLVYIYWANWRKWGNWRYYVFGAIAVFFPLVFMSSAVNVLINPTGSMISSYTNLYCQPAGQSGVCGKAFAAVVSSMSLRALPAVLSAPALVYFFLLKPKLK